MHKRAMSPLISTVILIGFAIALGGVVMSWGKSGYVTEKTVDGCEATGLSLISHGVNKGVCSSGDRLYFTVQNDGEISLDGVKVFVVGKDDVYSAVADGQMDVADVVKLDLEYPYVGEIEKLIFVPMFGLLDEEKLCPQNGFSVEEVGECLDEE